MKVAICLSGESRTYRAVSENIKNFFSESEFEFTYFGHTWTTNSWKEFHPDGYHYYDMEHLDISELHKDLSKEFPFAKLQISNPRPKPEVQYITWHSMSYSCMMANHLKQQYELKNDMKFDLVVHCRYDECMFPGHKFSIHVPSSLNDSMLYSHITVFSKEYRQHNINDVFYFGSSKVMDIIQNFYRVYHNGNFFKLTNTRDCDFMYKNVGYGVLLYKWATMKNIYPENDKMMYSQIARRGSNVIRTTKDYIEISEKNRTWGP